MWDITVRVFNVDTPTLILNITKYPCIVAPKL